MSNFSFNTILWIIIILILFIFFLLTSNLALAHKVSVFSYIENNQLKGEGYFISGGKAKNCRIEIYDAERKQIAITKTDETGYFSLPLPQGIISPLKIIILAGEGHQGDYIQPLIAADLEKVRQNQNISTILSLNQGSMPKLISEVMPTIITTTGTIDLERILGEILEKKLNSLTIQIAKLTAERGITFQDIIGGIGYILGLLGISAYVKIKKNKILE